MKEILKKIGAYFKDVPKRIKDNFKNRVFPRMKELIKKYLTKQVLTVIGIIALILALGFGGVKLYQYSRVAYLKPYIEKYHIEYPEGILEEMCDEYGKNQSVRGKISISDINVNNYFSGVIKNGYSFLENGADIKKEQHFRAIRMNAEDADLESVYSKPDLFLKSSQLVELTTLYEKEQYRVVAAFYTNTDPEDDNGYLFPYNLCGNITKKSFDSYIDRITHRALYDTGYEFSQEDYFLTLSVDSDFMENFRFVVVCVKVNPRKFEKAEIAVPNDRVHYPQIWYDKHDEENPYIFAGKWYPVVYVDEQHTTQLTIDDFA